MGVTRLDRSQNSVVLQFEVDDVKWFCEDVASRGGSVSFGPDHNEREGFWYAGINDIEGNPIWIVDAACP